MSYGTACRLRMQRLRLRQRPMPAYKVRRKRAEARALWYPRHEAALAAVRGVRAAERGISSFACESDALYARAARALMAGD